MALPDIESVYTGPQFRRIFGLAMLDRRLFVLRRPSYQQIEVYDTATTFAALRPIRVAGLESNTKELSLAASATNNCLYVGVCPNVIFRIQLPQSDSDDASGGSNSVTRWTTLNGEPVGLSVIPSSGNLLVACDVLREPCRILELTTGGTVVREIKLQKDLTSVRYALHLTGGQYLVSHGVEASRLHRVCRVDDDGRVRASYGGEPGSAVGQLDSPRHLAVCEADNFVLVADRRTSRIVVLDPSLTRSRSLRLPGMLDGPFALCYDESRGRLYVGENGGGRLLAYDGVVRVGSAACDDSI